MAEKATAVPEGVNTVAAYFSVCGVGKATEFYPQTFGGQLIFILKARDGKVLHANMKLGEKCHSEMRCHSERSEEFAVG